MEPSSRWDTEGNALAERLILAELRHLQPSATAAAPPSASAGGTSAHGLTAEQLELLGKLNEAMREEYAMRRAMLLKRLDVLLDSFQPANVPRSRWRR